MIEREAKVKVLIAQTQTRRLETVYDDFISQKKGFDQLPAFFREHLYCPHNQEKRHLALENLYKKLKSITGPQMMKNVHQLLLLSDLTDKLDLELAQALLAGPLKDEKDLDGKELHTSQLEWAIRASGQFAERERQIDMLCQSLQFFFSLSKLPMVKLVLAPIKVAASMTGAADLVATIEAGYELSRNIKTIQGFAAVFQEREKKYLQNLASSKNEG